MNQNHSYAQPHARQLAPAPSSMTRNGLIPSQGQSRPSSQTSSVGTQRHTPRPRAVTRHSSADVNATSIAEPLGQRLVVQQPPPLQPVSDSTVSFPSTLIPATTNSLGDQSMDYIFDSPAVANNISNQTGEMDDMQNRTSEAQYTSQMGEEEQEEQEPWWEAYSNLKASQKKTEEKMHEYEDKLRRNWRHIKTLEEQMQELEGKIGAKRTRRG